MKLYTARSSIAINVSVGERGAKRHVAFMTTTDGGSLLATADPELQAALEAHPMFGRLFRLAAVTPEPEPSAPDAPQPSPSPSASKRGKGPSNRSPQPR